MITPLTSATVPCCAVPTAATVAPGFALQIQHLEPVLVERINTFYGYRAVARLRLIQGPLPVAPPPRRPAFRALSASEEEALAATLAGLSDPTLREALTSLGRTLRGRPERGE